MCQNPIVIKNINYKSNNPYRQYQDTAFSKLYVPCGVCPDCLKIRQLYLVQRCLEQSKDNFILFCTLTYQDLYLPTLNVNGFTYHYVELSDFQNMLKRLRKSNIFPSFRYLCVTEYGGKKHRPHIHFLIFIPKKSSDSPTLGFKYEEFFVRFLIFENGWYRNIGSSRSPVYVPLCRFIPMPNENTLLPRKTLKKLSNWDCHLVTGVVNDNVPFYVSKYCLKYDKWLSRLQQALRLNLSAEDYLSVWSKLRPKVLLSKNFGIVDSTEFSINDFINHSLSYGRLKYIDAFGNNYPLSRYYRNKFMSNSQKISFWKKDSKRIDDTNSHYYEFQDPASIVARNDSFNRIKKNISLNDFDFLED